MMRVKECIWLTLFISISVIVVIYIYGRSDSKVQMGSKLSSSDSAPASSSDVSVSDHIQELIKKYPVMVFSKSYCPYSKKAKNILSKYKLGNNYHVLELDQLPSKADEYQDVLGKLTGASTVPRVFIDGKCIGGGDDTSALEKKGDLERLLREAKAIVE
jgi:glutaredoxin 3